MSFPNLYLPEQLLAAHAMPEASLFSVTLPLSAGSKLTTTLADGAPFPPPPGEQPDSPSATTNKRNILFRLISCAKSEGNHCFAMLVLPNFMPS